MPEIIFIHYLNNLANQSLLYKFLETTTMTSKDDCVDFEIKIEEFKNPDSLECKPAQKSLKEILETDLNDESLNKFGLF